MNSISNGNYGTGAFCVKGRLIFVAALLSTVFVSFSDAGIARFGIASGRITQFGSIFVNGRKFDISNAKIVLDGESGNEADLKLGQVVFVRGLLDDTDPVGEATEVFFADNVEGPITGINAAEERLTVLGQTILTDAQTVFDLQFGGNSFDELDLNEQIEVSGFITAEGDVLASRIEQKGAGGENEVIGTVTNLTATTFALNKLTVNFSGAVPYEHIITEGDIVEVKGLDFNTKGELIASIVELQERISGEFGELGEFEGLITDFGSASSFAVGGVDVSTNSMTTFIGGGPGNLTVDVSVEVAGEFDADGVLAASKVSIRGTRIRIHAQVDSVSVSYSLFRSLGITATVDSGTRWQDHGPIDADPFSLDHLYASDYVEVRSFKNPARSTPFHAEGVKRVDAESDVRLQGFVDYVGEQHFQIHGVTIVVQDTDFTDAIDKPISAAEFFSLLTTGTFVKVIGTETTSMSIDATEVGLQLND